IAVNLCRDQYRKLAKHRRDVSLNAPGPGNQPPLELADPGLSPGETASRQDRFAALQRAIDQLPHKLKSALILFSLEGRSQHEAADILGTTPKTVETRVYHAKEKLRQLLGNAF
ncbi:MAG TPA: sigma-70 family RNA polymerase sigma factor, partial [Dehalococcoidia bacterium]